MNRETVAIVTGGGSGIGRELCLCLARRGAKVVVADIDQAKAEETARDVQAAGGLGEARRTDVARMEEVEAVVRETAARHGRIDLLINNAGIGINGEFQDMTLEHWKRLLDVNFWGVLYGTHYVYPLMIRQGCGQIVNVSSLAGLIPSGLMSGYGAAKHAVVGLTLSLRAEARQYGIRVNALCPGFMETPIHDTSLDVTDYLKSQHQWARNRFPTAAACAERMMKGIERNRAIIIVPAAHRVFWWASRLSPALLVAMWSTIIRRLKKATQGDHTIGRYADDGSGP